VLSREFQETRAARRARRSTDLTQLERLEERTLLAFSDLGFSLPDLAISGEAGPRAAWGGHLNVSAFLQNTGASTITEPLSQAPATQPPIAGSFYGSSSTADAPDSTVAVLLTRSPKSLRGAITLGKIEAPPVAQNSVEQLAAQFTLPSRPAGFPGAGGKVYLWFVANASSQFPEASYTGNLSTPVPVMITSQPLPELRVIALSVPSTLQPGDTIQPQIQIENFGTADPDAQGPVTVDLVESVTRSFTLGSVVVASYTINSIPAVSQAPTRGNFRTFAKRILSPPANVATIIGSSVTLSTSPSRYFLGVVIDPNNTLRQLSLPANNFQQIRVVGPPVRNLPPAGVVSTPSLNQFPNPPTGVLIGVQ
jgi:hypothetical protein